MIWFLLGVLPLVAFLIWGLRVAFREVLLALSLTVLVFAAVTSGVYGMYDMGWIMQCGGDAFWTAEDC